MGAIGPSSKVDHWLIVDDDRRILRCRCGFVAFDEDNGYGDSVVDHLIGVGREAGRAEVADVDGIAGAMREHYLDRAYVGPDNDSRCVCLGWCDGDDWDDHLAEAVAAHLRGTP